jgi:hypothetical protein
MRYIIIIVWCLLATPALAGHAEPVACGQYPALTGNVTSPAGSCATTIAAGVVSGPMMTSNVALPAGGSAPSGFTLTDTINSEFHASTSQLTATSTTTLGVVTGLSQALTAGKTYVCNGHLAVSTGSASFGAKAGLVATASLSATSISYSVNVYSGTTLSTNTTATALAATSGGIGSTSTVTDIYVTGAIVVNVAGTINLEAAQNVSGSTATSFLINSTFSCVRVN